MQQQNMWSSITSLNDADTTELPTSDLVHEIRNPPDDLFLGQAPGPYNFSCGDSNERIIGALPLQRIQKQPLEQSRSTKMIGTYTLKSYRKLVKRHRSKQRVWGKKTQYPCRRRFALERPREKGGKFIPLKPFK